MACPADGGVPADHWSYAVTGGGDAGTRREARVRIWNGEQADHVTDQRDFRNTYLHRYHFHA